jgi:hypothetical protein
VEEEAGRPHGVLVGGDCLRQMADGEGQIAGKHQTDPAVAQPMQVIFIKAINDQSPRTCKSMAIKCEEKA